MKLVSIDNLVKKDVPLHYRNDYTAVVHLETSGQLKFAPKIQFSLEMHPTGKKDIKIQILDTLDYPLVPVIRVIREQIKVLDREGKLL